MPANPKNLHLIIANHRISVPHAQVFFPVFADLDQPQSKNLFMGENLVI
jgi:hypothetical protein